MPESDEIIYTRFLEKGANEDIKELMQRHREGLTLFLHGMGLSLEDAEEVMIDSFVAVGMGRSVFYGKSSFKTWLFSIGRNKALNHLKARRFDTVSLNDNIKYSEEKYPELDMLKKERDKVLYLALDRLKDEYRQILYLIYFEDMSIEDAARVMKKTRKQIYNLIQRSKEALKKELTESGADSELFI